MAIIYFVVLIHETRIVYTGLIYQIYLYLMDVVILVFIHCCYSLHRYIYRLFGHLFKVVCKVLILHLNHWLSYGEIVKIISSNWPRNRLISAG